MRPKLFLTVAVSAGLCLRTSSAYLAGPQAVAESQAQEGAALCKDSAGDLYSQGALVEVHGQLMECVIGPHGQPVEADVVGTTPSVLDASGENIEASFEASIIAALRGDSLPPLECDKVLNSERSPAQLTQVPAKGKLLLYFWTPTCPPCKPLLAELASAAEGGLRGLSLLGVVQSANPDVEPPGEWRLRRVTELMTDNKVGFPTCVHSSNEISRGWRAQGVPLMLLVSSENGLERAALGRRSGTRMLHDLLAAATSKER